MFTPAREIRGRLVRRKWRDFEACDKHVTVWYSKHVQRVCMSTSNDSGPETAQKGNFEHC